MDPAQHGHSAPVAQATAQGGAAGAPGGGSQLAPLHPLPDEEPQCLDDLDGRHGWSSGAERPVLDLVDDPRHQRRCPRRHVRLPMPKARKTDARSAGCPKADDRPGFWKPLLSQTSTNAIPWVVVVVVDILVLITIAMVHIDHQRTQVAGMLVWSSVVAARIVSV